MRLQNYISSEFVDPSDQKWCPHHNPWTGEISSEVPDSDVIDVVRAIQSANKALPNWLKVDVEQRARFLEAIAVGLESNASELARLQSEDEGCLEAHALQTSIPRAASVFRLYARFMLDDRSVSVSSNKAHFFTHRNPHGIAAIISPATDPLVMISLRVAPALAAGNVVLLKPSEYAPKTANAFAQTVHGAGLPSGVFNLVQGRGEKVGKTISTHPGLSLISLIGQTETGRELQRDAAEFLKRTHLSLSGRNPVLIFAGFDLKKAMPAILASTVRFEGPGCLRGSRIFVQETIYKEFLEAFRTNLETLSPTQIGPVNRASHRARFEAAVQQALDEKGKLLTGGIGDPEGLDEKYRGGYFVKPTAIYDLTNCSTLQQEEVPGPFVTISSFKYQHEALKHANTGPLGLAGYVFETQGAKALRVAQKLDAGRVFINSPGAVADERVPYGGLKNSGVGIEGAAAMMDFFSKPSLIANYFAAD